MKFFERERHKMTSLFQARAPHISNEELMDLRFLLRDLKSNAQQLLTIQSSTHLLESLWVGCWYGYWGTQYLKENPKDFYFQQPMYHFFLSNVLFFFSFTLAEYFSSQIMPITFMWKIRKESTYLFNQRLPHDEVYFSLEQLNTQMELMLAANKFPVIFAGIISSIISASIALSLEVNNASHFYHLALPCMITLFVSTILYPSISTTPTGPSPNALLEQEVELVAPRMRDARI